MNEEPKITGAGREDWGVFYVWLTFHPPPEKYKAYLIFKFYLFIALYHWNNINILVYKLINWM